MANDSAKERIFRCPSCGTLHIRRVSGKGEKMTHDCGTLFEDVTEEIDQYKGASISDSYD